MARRRVLRQTSSPGPDAELDRASRQRRRPGRSGPGARSGWGREPRRPGTRHPVQGRLHADLRGGDCARGSLSDPGSRRVSTAGRRRARGRRHPGGFGDRREGLPPTERDARLATHQDVLLERRDAGARDRHPLPVDPRRHREVSARRGEKPVDQTPGPAPPRSTDGEHPRRECQCRGGAGAHQRVLRQRLLPFPRGAGEGHPARRPMVGLRAHGDAQGHRSPGHGRPADLPLSGRRHAHLGRHRDADNRVPGALVQI